MSKNLEMNVKGLEKFKSISEPSKEQLIKVNADISEVSNQIDTLIKKGEELIKKKKQLLEDIKKNEN